MSSYIPIRLRTIPAHVSLDFDAYISVAGKYVHYIKKGDDISEERILNLRNKNVKKLFILTEDEALYQQFLDKRISDAIHSPDMAPEDRAETATSMAASSLEQMHEDPQNKQVFLLLEKATLGIAKIVGKKKNILGLFMSKVENSSADPIVKHALNVASLCCCLGEELQISEKEIQNICTSALLMDIGIVKMPPDSHHLFMKKRDEIHHESWKIFKEHPKISRDMLEGKDYINPDILELVYTHEELLSGEGFPNGIQKLSLNQGILGLCACFDRQINFFGRTYKEAIEEISVNQLGNFDLKLIKTLKSLLKNQSIHS